MTTDQSRREAPDGIDIRGVIISFKRHPLYRHYLCTPNDPNDPNPNDLACAVLILAGGFSDPSTWDPDRLNASGQGSQRRLPPNGCTVHWELAIV